MAEEIKTKNADPRNVYLVFVKAQYVRDAQAFTGKDTIMDDIWDDEDGWQDISGPVLCAVYHNFPKETVEEKIHTLYPNAPKEVFEYVSVQQLLDDGYLGIF